MTKREFKSLSKRLDRRDLYTIYLYEEYSLSIQRRFRWISNISKCEVLEDTLKLTYSFYNHKNQYKIKTIQIPRKHIQHVHFSHWLKW